MGVILVVVGTFALCFGIDKLFTKLFRSQKQHRSGLSVRLSKHYAIIGVLLVVLGIGALVSGVLNTPALTAAGAAVLVLGICLVVYYMTFGVFYDADSFILTTFGKKNTVYSFGDIRCQQLYVVQGGNMIVELYMTDGRTVQIQSAMEGMVPFLDHAFTAWLRQTGRDPQTCDFHDPANYCWFPPLEVQ